MIISTQTTEQALAMWRGSQSDAERMVARLLHFEGFERVDPQLPLGGGDGNKDILCERQGETYVVGCYFPVKEKAFADIKKKFVADLQGRRKNTRDSFLFATNAEVSPKNRKQLIRLGKEDGAKTVEILHRERLIALLDLPGALSVRSKFLRIQITPEEQVDFFSAFAPDLMTKPFGSSRNQVRSDDRTAIAVPVAIDEETARPFSRFATIASLEQLHFNLMSRLELPENFEQFLGKLRSVQVWIGSASSGIENARHVPPPAEQVLELTESLLAKWSKDYDSLMNAPATVCAKAIASFHHQFMSIHPFADGNGRVGRALMVIQGAELMPLHPLEPVVNQYDYYKALSVADRGSMEELEYQIVKWFGLDGEKRSEWENPGSSEGWLAQ